MPRFSLSLNYVCTILLLCNYRIPLSMCPNTVLKKVTKVQTLALPITFAPVLFLRNDGLHLLRARLLFLCRLLWQFCAVEPAQTYGLEINFPQSGWKEVERELDARWQCRLGMDTPKHGLNLWELLITINRLLMIYDAVCESKCAWRQLMSETDKRSFSYLIPPSKWTKTFML